jgi:hypothetical protein
LAQKVQVKVQMLLLGDIVQEAAGSVAQKVQVLPADDFDGSEATETVMFGVLHIRSSSLRSLPALPVLRSISYETPSSPVCDTCVSYWNVSPDTMWARRS